MQLLIIHIGVGDMPPGRLKEHCEEVRTNFREALGLHEIKMVILPQIGGQNRVELIDLAD